MRTALDCYPCFCRQALDAARHITADPVIHARVLRTVCAFCAEMDLSKSPPAIGQQIHRIIREVTGDSDPYRHVKQQFNQHAMALCDRLRQRLATVDDPLDAALRLAIAGNSIDFGARSNISEQDTTAIAEQAFRWPLNGQMTSLKQAIADARSILILADNAGEIAFDMLLVQQIPLDKMTVAVRGQPVINDATMEDAVAIGLTDLVTVIDNGADAPGTVLEDCSAQFVAAFYHADLIISKGQGNYESLSNVHGHNIYYLLIPKCKLVADQLGCPEGSFVVRSPREIDS